MKITKDQLRQMIREALSTDESDVQKMVDVYIKQFGGVDKIKKFTKGNNKEEKIQYTIKNLQSRFDKIPFDLVNKAAVQIIKMAGLLDEKQSINMKDVEMKEAVIMKHLKAMFDELGREELPKRFSEESLLKPIIDRYISARRNVREPYFDKLTGRMKNK
jgi:hypothetical protein